MYKKGNNKTRKEIIQELLSNDPRSKNQQVWTLAFIKKKKKGPAPRCINNISYWTNLKPPDGIRSRADRSISDDTIAALKDNGLPL